MNFLRRLLGRGRRRHFFVTPYIRQLKKMFEKHPLVMNAVTYGALCTGAELSQQTLKYHLSAKNSTCHIVSNRTLGMLQLVLYGSSIFSLVFFFLTDDGVKNGRLRYDFSAVKRLALWGTIVVPPIYVNWYKFLEKLFPPTGVISKQQILKKTFLDQFIFTPPVLVLFFGIMGYLEYRNWQDATNEVKFKFPPVYLADCAFWIPVQAVNFAYVPPTLRVLYVGIMSFIWLNFLCFARDFKQKATDNS